MKDFFDKKAREVFGEDCKLASLERLLGDAQKHTWLAKCTNNFSFVIYQWSGSATYFDYDQADAVFRSSSAGLFELNNRLFREAGALTPKLYYMDRSRQEQDCEYCFVEYIDGADMDYILAHEPERLDRVIEGLTVSVNRLHKIKSNRIGQEGRLQDEGFDVLPLCLKSIAENSEYLQSHDAERKEFFIKVEARAKSLAEILPAWSSYTFIHGELGPNHVMVDKDDTAYLIDIEGAKYCDVEEENSFLNFRFERRLKGVSDPVDADRMLFYHVFHCFGNLRGAIELKQKGYYDMADLQGMINFFHTQFDDLAR